ncbi:glycoside hydrolase superfamily [Apiospora arundinis]
MASLQYLPDELLLEILIQLPIESFYCITKTCRVFRRLRHDKSLDFSFHPVFPEHLLHHEARRLYFGSVGHYQVDMSMLNPPNEQAPPWRADRATSVLPMYQSGQNVAMMPYDVRNDIRTNIEMDKTVELMLRDALCISCYEFRYTILFAQNLRHLMSPVRCKGCNIHHPRIHFSDSSWGAKLLLSEPICIGRTGLFKMCAHVRLNWKEYQKASRSEKIHCGICKASFGSRSASVRTQVELLRCPRVAFRIGNDTLKVLRDVMGKSTGYVCPHVDLGCAEFVDYVFHNMKFDSPSDAVWLAQLELKKSRRLAATHRITWCEDSNCATTRGGRKEALLIRMLEMVMVTPERNNILGVCPLERSQWLNGVCAWFWSPDPRVTDLSLSNLYYSSWSGQMATVYKVTNSMTASNGEPFRAYFTMRIDESSPMGILPADWVTPEWGLSDRWTPQYVQEYKSKTAAVILAVTLGDREGGWPEPETIVVRNLDLYKEYLTSDGEIYRSAPGPGTWKATRKMLGKLRSLLGIHYRVHVVAERNDTVQ